MKKHSTVRPQPVQSVQSVSSASQSSVPASPSVNIKVGGKVSQNETPPRPFDSTKYSPLITKLSRRYSQLSIYKDIQQECHLSLLSQYHKFDPSRATELTWAHNIVTWAIYNYLNKFNSALNYYERVTLNVPPPQEVNIDGAGLENLAAREIDIDSLIWVDQVLSRLDKVERNMVQDYIINEQSIKYMLNKYRLSNKQSLFRHVKQIKEKLKVIITGLSSH